MQSHWSLWKWMYAWVPSCKHPWHLLAYSLTAGALPIQVVALGGPWGPPCHSSRIMLGSPCWWDELLDFLLCCLLDAMVSELSQLKPLRAVLLLIPPGGSHSCLRKTSDFHLWDAWLSLSYPKRWFQFSDAKEPFSANQNTAAEARVIC